MAHTATGNRSTFFRVTDTTSEISHHDTNVIAKMLRMRGIYQDMNNV